MGGTDSCELCNGTCYRGFDTWILDLWYIINGNELRYIKILLDILRQTPQMQVKLKGMNQYEGHINWNNEICTNCTNLHKLHLCDSSLEKN